MPTGRETGGSIGALAGIRVVDFGQYIAGPLAAMMLADNGAEVIRVDPPGGPRWDHPANAILQRGKRCIELDLHKPEDVKTAGQLIETSDIVIEGFRPGVMRGWGLNPSTFVGSVEGLIWCSIPGFGHDDPRATMRAWEGVLCSATGLYPASSAFASCGSGRPRFSAIPMASNFGAFVAAHSIAAALIARYRYGHGDYIEVPLYDAAFEAIAYHGESPGSTEQITPRQPEVAVVRNSALTPSFGSMKAYRCRDGRYIAYLGMPARGFHAFWDRYLPLELKDRDDPEAVREATVLLESLFATKDAVEWERECQEELGASFALAQTSADWLNDSHALASQSVLEIDDPVLGKTRQVGFGVVLNRSTPEVRWPRRQPNADSEAIRDSIGAGKVRQAPNESSPRPARVENAARRALEGVRVLDFSLLLAGPIGARVLASYGADVIKVNKASIGRGEADPYTDDPMTFSAHRTTNAGKRTVFLNLKSNDGRRIGAELVKTADIIHHNFTLDKASRLGLGPDLCEQYPELIYSTLNLHSRGGWRENFRGHEDLAQDVTGLSLRYGGGAPEMHGILINDHAAGHLSAFGVLLALFDRYRTGTGQMVSAALSRTAATHQLPFMIEYSGAESMAPGGTDAVGWSALDRLYETSEGWLYLAAKGRVGIANLQTVAGLEELTPGADVELAAELQARFIAEPARIWVDRLTGSGISAHQYLNIDDVMDDPVAKNRGLSTSKHHPGMGMGRGIGDVSRFESSPNWHIPAARHPGWDTVDVVSALGYGDRVEDLLASGVVAVPLNGLPSGGPHES